MGALLCLVIALGALVATAPKAAAQAEIEVQTGFGGRHEFGADLVVRVRLETDRLIDATLQAVPSAEFGTFPVVEIPAEVAGGSTKEFLLVLPGFQQWGGGVNVNLIEDGVVTATAFAPVKELGEDELVGVMPTLAEQIERNASLSVALGSARTFPIDQRWLEAGVGAIDTLSSIVAAPADLQALDTDSLDVIDQWIFQGGTLIVDDAPGIVPGLNVNTSATPTGLGHGWIISTDWSKGQGSGDSLIAPSERRLNRNSPFPDMIGDSGFFGGDLANELANDAGFGLPPLPWVLALLALYILLAGPIAWFVLRRMGKSRMMWTLLPALALLFTGGVWLAGSAIRSGTTGSHGTVIEIADGRAQVTSTILSLSRNGGQVTMDLPDGWRVIGSQPEGFGPNTDGATQVLRTGAGTNRIDIDLAAGQFATMAGRGPDTSFVDAVTAVANSPVNGSIAGSVTNNLDVELHEVVVFAGGDGINIGAIAPNATVPFTLKPNRQNQFGEPIEFRVWRNAMNRNMGRFNGSVVDQKINVSLWGEHVAENLGRSRPLGEITVAAWTRELASPLDNDIKPGRTLIIASAPVGIANGVLTDMANQRLILRSPSQLGDGQPDFDRGFVLDSAWRFDIPMGVDASNLGLHLPNRVTKVELWTGNEWRMFEEPASGLYELPADVFHKGSVTAKISLDFDRGPTSLGPDLSLRTITPDDKTLDDLLGGGAA